MNAEPYVNRILDDEGLVGDLEGDAAEQLVGWLVHAAERIASRSRTDAIARSAIEGLCRRGKEIAAAAARQSDPKAALSALLAKEPKAD
jgi:hypothetical protein